MESIYTPHLAPAAACPSEELLVQFIEGAGDGEDDRARTEAHFDVCPPCREALAAMARILAPTPSGAPENSGTSAFEIVWPPGKEVGRFVVTGLVGRGGMGAVYAARDPELDRVVALKVLRLDLAGDTIELEARLRGEAAAMAKTVHPAVVTVYDVGVHDGCVFIAMELIAGQTLAAWLLDPRDWRTIAGKLVAAGRGLAAAHDAGLVHRDFKPENVLLDERGDPHVADFGVARAVFRQGPAARGGDQRQALSLTMTGSLVGTPLYMAPEQLRGEPATPASDQFSFFVSLFRGLTGERPFAGSCVSELLESIETRPPDRGAGERRVPTPLWPIVVRGLSVAPEDRFPSMNAALAAIEAAIGRRRRRAWLAGLAVLIGALSVAGWALAKPSGSACGAASERVGEIWNPMVRTKLAAAFARAAPSFARDASRRVGDTLDDYSARWTAMHREACEATAVHGHQTSAQLDLRMRCLERRRNQMGALIDRFREGEKDVVLRASDAARGLPSIEDCADLDALSEPVPPPTDPRKREKVEALSRLVGEVESHYAAGTYQRGAEIADALVPAAVELGYRPLEAEARYARAKIRTELGDHVGERDDLERAVLAAVAGRHDQVAAKTAIELIITVAHRLGDLAGIEPLERQAEAALERAGGGADLAERLVRARAVIAWNRGEMDRAEAMFTELLRSGEKRHGPNAAELLMALNGLSAVASRRLDGLALVAISERILAIQREHLGDAHPDLAETLGKIGYGEYLGGRYKESLAHTEDAIARRSRYLGPDHPSVSALLANASVVYSFVGEQEKAVAMARRVLDIDRREFGPRHRRTAAAMVGLSVLIEVEEKHDEAHALLTGALEIFREVYPADHQATQNALGTLAYVEFGMKRYDAALSTALESRAMEARLGALSDDLARTLGEIYLALDRPSEALAPLEQARELVAAATNGGDGMRALWIDSRLAMALYDSGRDKKRGRRLAIATELALRAHPLLEQVHTAHVAWMKARSIARSAAAAAGEPSDVSPSPG